jgi:hypothetical protein
MSAERRLVARILDAFVEFLAPPRPSPRIQAQGTSFYQPPLYIATRFTFEDAVDMFEQDWMSQFGVYYREAPRQAAPPQPREPVFKGVDVTDPEATCSICLGGYDGTQKAVRTRCRHVYHAACIHEWIRTQAAAAVATCPFCRKEL